MCEQVVTFNVQLKNDVSFESFRTNFLEAAFLMSNWRVADYAETFRFAVNPVDHPAIVTFTETCDSNSGAQVVLTFDEPSNASKYAAFGPTHESDLCCIAFNCGACAVGYGRATRSVAVVQIDPPSASAVDNPYSGDDAYWDQMPEGRG